MSKKLELKRPVKVESCWSCKIGINGGGKTYCIIIMEYNNNPGTIHVNCELPEWKEKN